jgi:hypothetical protein
MYFNKMADENAHETNAEIATIQHINDLEAKLIETKYKLLMMRLSKLVDIDINDFTNNNIYKLKFYFNRSKNKWSISYDHKTDNYNDIYYINDYDEDVEVKHDSMESSVTMGRNDSFFISSKSNIKFIIYKNSKNKIKIINDEYTYELDDYENEELILRYSNNKNIPEWFAIRIFLKISDMKWTDNEIIDYFINFNIPK